MSNNKRIPIDYFKIDEILNTVELELGVQLEAVADVEPNTFHIMANYPRACLSIDFRLTVDKKDLTLDYNKFRADVTALVRGS